MGLGRRVRDRDLRKEDRIGNVEKRLKYLGGLKEL